MPFVVGNLLIIKKKSSTTDFIWAQNLWSVFVFSNKGTLENIKVYTYHVKNLL